MKNGPSSGAPCIVQTPSAFSIPGLGSSEPFASTGFHLALSVPLEPPLTERSGAEAQRGRHSLSVSLPPVPPPTPQASAWIPAETYEYVDNESLHLLPAMPRGPLLRQRTTGEKGTSVLACLFVALAMCAFAWLVASGSLAEQAGIAGQEPDSAKDVVTEPPAVLHLEENSAAVPSIAIKVGGGVAGEVRTRTARATRRRSGPMTSRRPAQKSTQDGKDEMSGYSWPARTAEDLTRTRGSTTSVTVLVTLEAGKARGKAPAEDEAKSEASPAFDDRFTTRAKRGRPRKSSRKWKRRHLYPRRHIHRESKE
ncbi:uncharacterized protein LOC144123392 [Amblyomma americanum]